jgi:hypothetical protein
MFCLLYDCMFVLCPLLATWLLTQHVNKEELNWIELNYYWVTTSTLLAPFCWNSTTAILPLIKFSRVQCLSFGLLTYSLIHPDILSTFLAPSEGQPSYWPCVTVIWEHTGLNLVIGSGNDGFRKIYILVQLCETSGHTMNSHIMFTFHIQWPADVPHHPKFCRYVFLTNKTRNIRKNVTLRDLRETIFTVE